MLKYQMFQAPELKSSIWLWLIFLNALAIGQQPMHEMPAFEIHPDLFKQASLAKGGVHFVECMGVFIYYPFDYLIGYQLAPIGNGAMRVLLSYTGGCATPLFDSIYIDPLVDRSKVLPINAPPGNYLPDRMQDLYRKTASTTVPKLIKLNNRHMELNVDLVPNGLNIEANRNWVKQTSYDPVSGLPRKVVVLYDTQVMHYSFIYQGVVPDWFR